MNSGGSDPALLQLVRDLLERTEAGKVKWAETDNADEYIFSAQSSSVLVSSRIDGDGDRSTVFSLINSRGAEAASLKSLFSGDEMTGYIPEPVNEELDKLFFAARRNVLDIDSTLNDIYRALRADEME